LGSLLREPVLGPATLVAIRAAADKRFRQWVTTVGVVARLLVTVMSGTRKTTVLRELRRRGHLTVHTDYDGWELPDGLWDEPRMTRLLASTRVVIVSGAVDNQGWFYDRFDHVVLLSAPLELDGRLATSELANRLEELVAPA
jgi:hypothetical protein